MDFTGITEGLAARLTDAAINRLLQKVKVAEDGVTVRLTKGESSGIPHHLRMINQWASKISFRELVKSKEFRDVFVDLDLHLGTNNEADSIHKYSVSDLLFLPGHFVLLGDPGSGKTTSLKRLAMGALRQPNDNIQSVIPLLIQLRDFSREDRLSSYLIGQLGISVSLTGPGLENLKDQEREQFVRRALSELLDTLGCILMVDGLDELNPQVRDSVVAELRYYLLHMSKSRIVLTCRRGDFTYHFENSNTVSLQPLSEEQIAVFAQKWLGGDRAQDFLTQIRSTPYSGSEVRPLTLAHLCAIYERSGSVPNKPRTVYRKIIRLLLEEWDEQRSVRRYSRYANFEIDRKEDFLEALAFEITSDSKRTRFSDQVLQNAYLAVHEHFGLPRKEARQVAKEIESHSGLIVQVTSDTYEFAHKALQEYLTAAFMLKLPDLPRNLNILPGETALAVALSSNPTKYLCAVIRDASETITVDPEFIDALIRRLIVEKVDFVADPQLGTHLLWLYWKRYFAYQDTSAALRARKDIFLDFLSLPPVISSVRSVLKLNRISQPRNGFCSVYCHPEYRSLSPTRRIDHLLIDCALLEYIEQLPPGVGDDVTEDEVDE
jgi:hypothetical protein